MTRISRLFFLSLLACFLIHGLSYANTTDITPNAVGVADNSGDILSDIISDNGPVNPPGSVTSGDGCYTVGKMKTMYLDGFEISSIPTGSKITNAILHLQYGSVNGYYGTAPVNWSLHGGILQSTLIIPNDTGGNAWSPDKSFNLYDQGVTTAAQLQTLDIQFYNNASTTPKEMSFDYLWITVTYTPPPPRPTINAVSSPTNNKTQLLTGQKSAETTAVYVYCASATVNSVSYPTSTSWQVSLTNLSEGNNAISANAENSGAFSLYTTANIFVDSIAPAKPTINAVSSPTKNTTQVLSGQKSSDTVTINVVCSTASFNAASYPTATTWQVTLNNLAEGTNFISVNAQDAYYNQSGYATASIIVDNTPPATPSITSLPISINITSATVSGTAETNSLVSIFVSNNLYSTTNAAGGVFSVVVSGLSQGTTVIKVTAADALNNISGTASSTIFVDTIAPATPSITTNGGSNFSTQDATVTLSGTCSADTKTILVNNSISNVTFTPYTTSWSYLAALGAGANTYNVVALDILDNHSGTASIIVSRDTNVPADPVINAVSTPTNNKTQLLTGTMAANTTTINVTCNTATVGTISYPTGTTWRVTVSSMAEANNRITVNAQNSYGYSNDVFTMIFVDTVPPNTPNINSLPASINSTSIAVTGTAETNSLVSIYRGPTLVGTANATGGNYAVTASGLVEGYNNIYVTAKDNVNNLSPTASSIIYVDLTAPPTPTVVNLPASINMSAYDIEGTAETGSLVKIYVGGTLKATGNVNGGGAYIINVSSLAEGSNSIKIAAQDIYGNNSPSLSSTIYVDTIKPPTPSITTNGGNSFTTTNFTITLQGTVATDCHEIRVNGSTAGVSYTPGGTNWSFTVDLNVGRNDFNVAAEDAVNNQSGPASISVTLNLVYPDVFITPNAKNAGDNTGDLLADIIADDAVISPPDAVSAGDNVYTVRKSQTMYLDGFNTSAIPSGALLTAVTLYLQYGTGSSYDGNGPVEWSYTGATFNSTGIVPVNTGGAWSLEKTSDLLAQGVTNSSQAQNLKIRFTNNDSGNNDSLSFDYLYLRISYKPLPTVSISPVSSPTNNKTQLLIGTKSAYTTTVSVQALTASVNTVIYPTVLSWRVTLNNLSEGDNPITVNATNESGTANATTNIFVDSIAPAKPTINAVSSPTKSATQVLSGQKSSDTVTINILCSTASFNAVSYPTATTWQVTLNNISEGTNLISVNAQDAYYNQSGYATASIVVDNTPPTTPSITSLPISINITSATVSGTAEVDSLITIYVSGNFDSTQNATGGIFSKALTGLSQGITLIKATATDALGNISGTASSTIFVDTIPPATPSITTNGGSDFSTQDATVTLSGTCSADTKTILVNNSASNVTFTAYTTSWSYLAALGAGANTYNVVALDILDNRSGTASIVVSRDTNVPADPVINAVSSPTNNKTQLLTGTMAANTTTINVTCNTATVGPVSYPTTTSWRVTVSNMAEGNNRITVNAQNQFGYSNDVFTVIFVDTVPPNTPNINSLPASINSTSIAVTGTAETNSLVSIYRGTTLVGTTNATGGNYAVTVSSLVAGSNSIKVTARDSLNNLSPTASSTVYVDLTPPNTPNFTSIPASINTTSYIVTGTAEANSLVRVYKGASLAGTANAIGGSFAVTVSGLAQNINSIYATAQDIYGNTGPTASSVLFVDTIPPAAPVITTNGGNDFTTINSTVTVNGTTATDTVTIKVNGSTASVTYTSGATTWTYKAALSAGINQISVTAVDLYGNVSGPDIINITLQVDDEVLNILPDTKSTADNTTDTLTDMVSDDAAIAPPAAVATDNVYTVIKGAKMQIDGFNTSGIPTGALLTSAVLHVQYGSESGYSGTDYVNWAKHGQVLINSDIRPSDTGGTWSTDQTFNLFAQGVTTAADLKTLDIGFTNLDSGSAQAFSFDYLWITVTYKPKPATPTITAPDSPTESYSQLLTGTKDKHTATINVLCNTATVGTVSYPTVTSWEAWLTNLSLGDNPISVNAQNKAGSSGYVTTNINVFNVRVHVTKNMLIQAPADYVSKGGNSNALVPGGTIVIYNSFKNSSTVSVNNIVITDTLPNINATYVSNSAISSLPASINYQHVEGGSYDTDQTPPVIGIKWLFPSSMAPGQSGTVTFSATVN